MIRRMRAVALRAGVGVLVLGYTLSATGQDSRSPVLVVKDETVTALPGPECGTTKFLVSGTESRGAFALLEGRECGSLTGLHRHNRSDEAFYVIEGQLRVWVNGQVHLLNAGDYVFIPRGTPHAQGSPDRTPNRILVTITPAGFEELLRYRAELLTTLSGDSPEFINAMAERQKLYDIERLGPTPPELARR